MGMSMETGEAEMPMADDSAVTTDPAGIQHVLIEVKPRSYSPSRVQVRAGVPTKLTLRTKGNRDCTRGFVIPAMNLERTLPETGDTEIDLGTPAAGRIDYVCSVGMYRGMIEAQ